MVKNSKPIEEEVESENNDNSGSDFDEDVSPAIYRRVIALQNLQNNADEIDEEYKKERIILEQKFLEKKLPLFEKRNAIILGDFEPPITEDNTDEGEIEGQVEGEEKGIPGFWLQCLGNHPSCGDFITEDDVSALEALTDLQCVYDESYSSFTLTFTFAENDYFTNETLTKKYTVEPDLLSDASPALVGNVGSEIDWKEGKSLLFTVIKKKTKVKIWKE
jgi:nucleosome assembly protein 1-like 1